MIELTFSYILHKISISVLLNKSRLAAKNGCFLHKCAKKCMDVVQGTRQVNKVGESDDDDKLF